MKYEECKIGQNVIVISHNFYKKELVGRIGTIVHILSKYKHSSTNEIIGIDFKEYISCDNNKCFPLTWVLENHRCKNHTGRYLQPSDIELYNSSLVELL